MFDFMFMHQKRNKTAMLIRTSERVFAQTAAVVVSSLEQMLLADEFRSRTLNSAVRSSDPHK